MNTPPAPDKGKGKAQSPFKRISLRTALIYGLAAAAWILISDRLLDRLVADRNSLQFFAVSKGLFFVSITALLLYATLRRQLQAAEREVQKRAQAENALALSETRYRALVENIQDLVCELDMEGRYLYVSPNFSTTLGYAPGELLGASGFDHIHPDDLEVAKAQFGIPSGKAQFRFQHKDGSWRWFDVSGNVYKNTDGQQREVVIARDITGRVSAEQRLRQLSRAVEQSPAAIVITDTKGTIEYVNPKFTEITGYTPEEAVGKNPRILKSGDKDGTEYSDLWKTITAGKEWHGVFRNKTKDGRFFWESASISPITDSRGKITHFVAVKEDITERKEAERKIERLTQLYAALSQCNQAIVRCTSEGELFPQICRDAVEFGGMKMAWIAAVDEQSKQARPVCSYGEGTEYLDRLDLSADENNPTGRGPFGIAFRSGEPYWCQDFQNDPLSAPWHERAGRFGWKSVASLPLTRRGKTVYVFALYSDTPNAFDDDAKKLLTEMATDINFALENFSREAERKQVELALRESESRFRAIWQASPLGIFMTDENRRNIFVNDAHCRISGDEPHKLLGMGWLENIHPEDRARAVAEWEGIQRTHKSFQGTRRYVHADGKIVWVSITAAPILDGDTVRGFVGISEDITERRQLEQQFLRAQRMESIGTLASGVAHDLNNILAPILMSTDLLREEMPRERLDTIISTIEESARRCADVVRQVLTFARGMEGARAALQIRHLVKEMEKIMRETFPRNITITNRLPNDLWPVVGDATQLHQVLLNLCINARDAMPSGGSLTLSGENMDVDESYAAMVPDAKPGSYVILEVRDTGTGIPDDVVGKIFDPFFTTKEIGKGTGLGLSTTLGIVRSHGGFLSVKSEPVKGTTFRVFLPAGSHGEANPPQRRLAAKAPQGAGEWLLVVDDEEAIRTVTEVVLKTSGYNVITASNGTDAMTQYARHFADIRVVITDVMMPGMDGLSFARSLKKVNPQVKIIASTGHADESRMAELRTLGITALHKPYVAEKLLTAIHHILHPENEVGGGQTPA